MSIIVLVIVTTTTTSINVSVCTVTSIVGSRSRRSIRRSSSKSWILERVICVTGTGKRSAEAEWPRVITEPPAAETQQTNLQDKYAAICRLRRHLQGCKKIGLLARGRAGPGIMSTASESAIQPPLEARVQGCHITAGIDASATTLRGRCVVFYVQVLES